MLTSVSINTPTSIKQNKRALRRRGRILRIKAWYINLKKSKRCTLCNIEDWRVLDFHHVDPKKKKATVSRLVCKGYGKKLIQREIKKCIIICANCHRKSHYGQGNLRLRRRGRVEKHIIRLKNEGKCSNCPEDAATCLEYNHRNPATKTFTIGHAARLRYKLEEVIKEIELCDLLCANCHRIWHIENKKD